LCEVPPPLSLYEAPPTSTFVRDAFLNLWMRRTLNLCMRRLSLNLWMRRPFNLRMRCLLNLSIKGLSRNFSIKGPSLNLSIKGPTLNLWMRSLAIEKRVVQIVNMVGLYNCTNIGLNVVNCKCYENCTNSTNGSVRAYS
jgi:hypothetical protein